MTEHNDSISAAAAKVASAWLFWLGGVTLTEWLTVLGIVYTAVQLYVLVRDKIVRDRR